jgi:putative oxidoreductase
MRSFGLLILRLALGGTLMAHGSQKVFGAFEGPGMEGFKTTTKKLGLEPAEIMAPIGAYSEFLGGLSVLLGLFTPAGALAIINTMVVAIWKVHAKNGFWNNKRGWEFNGLIIGAAAALALGGPGKLSVDNLLFGSRADQD